jgi:hypothetical protein
MNISGVSLSYFTHGDQIWYDSRTGVMTSYVSAWKKAMAGIVMRSSFFFPQS